MSSHEREILAMLNDAGARLARQRKHRIFRFPDGRIWVVPKTPSDVHAWKNNLSDLRRRLNLRAVSQ
jgi:predicted RNA binding protein YcfA (HicA-like mRNA interferase family)